MNPHQYLFSVCLLFSAFFVNSQSMTLITKKGDSISTILNYNTSLTIDTRDGKYLYSEIAHIVFHHTPSENFFDRVKKKEITYSFENVVNTDPTSTIIRGPTTIPMAPNRDEELRKAIMEFNSSRKAGLGLQLFGLGISVLSIAVGNAEVATIGGISGVVLSVVGLGVEFHASSHLDKELLRP